MNLWYRTILPVAGLIALLVISLSFNYFLVKRYRHAYRELSRVTLDPLGLNQLAPETTAETEARQGELVVFFGDSRAAAWPSPEVDNAVFVNRGVNGQTSAQAALRYAIDTAPLRPDVVIVQVGINDLRVIPAVGDDSTAATAVTAAKAATAATAANIRHIVEQAAAGGAIVVLTTIFPAQTPPWQERMFWSEEVMTAVTAVNQDIRVQATDRVLVLDAYALLVNDNGELADAYAQDYLHLNAAGYRRLNDALRDVLARKS
ncbi:MAG: SGNH/GDSL hydrolase family protein [Chloroflexi bacterium]|nr:SGNH/GDSL hydrolase family protein [Chloroflexota bacterium]MBP7045655.1 SGNH/GDSL hydrolase family protein [Chloroflexota bacterium]